MTNLFNNYDKHNIVIPDNRYEFIPIDPEYKDAIVRGTDVEHCFKIPHRISEILSVRVVYFQGIEEKLIIPFSRIELKESNDISDNYCSAQYVIRSDESLLFNTYNKQTNVQLQIAVHQDSGEPKIEYSGIYKIKVLPTLFTMDEDTNKEEN